MFCCARTGRCWPGPLCRRSSPRCRSRGCRRCCDAGGCCMSPSPPTQPSSGSAAASEPCDLKMFEILGLWTFEDKRFLILWQNSFIWKLNCSNNKCDMLNFESKEVCILMLITIFPVPGILRVCDIKRVSLQMLEANNARSLAISKNFGGMRLSGRKIGFLEHSGLTYRGPGVCGQLWGQLGRLGSLWGLWLAQRVQRW